MNGPVCPEKPFEVRREDLLAKDLRIEPAGILRPGPLGVPRQLREARHRQLLPDLREDRKPRREHRGIPGELARRGRPVEREVELDRPERLEAGVFPQALHLEGRFAVALVVHDAFPAFVCEARRSEKDLRHAEEYVARKQHPPIPLRGRAEIMERLEIASAKRLLLADAPPQFETLLHRRPRPRAVAHARRRPRDPLGQGLVRLDAALAGEPDRLARGPRHGREAARAGADASGS